MNVNQTDQIEELNKKMDNCQEGAVLKSYSQEYFEALRQCLPKVMATVAEENISDKHLKALKLIFPLQRSLMNIRIITGVDMGDDLWQIAKDFDNDDPNMYAYLLKKIKNKEYLIQAD